MAVTLVGMMAEQAQVEQVVQVQVVQVQVAGHLPRREMAHQGGAILPG